jgi:hypothetical protein
MAIPMPMENKEMSATPKVGNTANSIAPPKANKKALISKDFSGNFSTNIPEGMDMTPYATKKAKGRNPANPILRLKLSMISGIIGPRILVRKEMTKNIRKIRMTINVFLFIIK